MRCGRKERRRERGGTGGRGRAFQVSLSSTTAVRWLLLVALTAVKQRPSGDQQRRSEKVALPTVRAKGSLMTATLDQSSVLHTMTALSSPWLARYVPTGSHDTPFTKLSWPARRRA